MVLIPALRPTRKLLEIILCERDEWRAMCQLFKHVELSVNIMAVHCSGCNQLFDTGLNWIESAISGVFWVDSSPANFSRAMIHRILNSNSARSARRRLASSSVMAFQFRRMVLRRAADSTGTAHILPITPGRSLAGCQENWKGVRCGQRRKFSTGFLDSSS